MSDDFRMKRDLDLCLTILKKLAHHPAEEVRFRPLDIDGFDQETIGYHVWLLGNGVTWTLLTIKRQPAPLSMYK